MSIERSERRERDLEILQLLLQGEKEIAAGVGHDLEEVLADADELLGGDSQ